MRHPGHPTLAIAFILLAVLATVAFWPHYLAQLPGDFAWPTHVHAVGVSAWLALLIVQPLLIHFGSRRAHRLTGWTALGIALLVVVSSVGLAVYMTRPGTPGFEEFRYELFALQLGSSACFALWVGAGFFFRRDAATHLRCMVASGLTFIDPIMARIMVQAFPEHAGLQSYGSSVTALICMLLLTLADRRSLRSRPIFAMSAVSFSVVTGASMLLGQNRIWRQLVDSWLG